MMTSFFVLAKAYNLFGLASEDNIMVLFVSFVVLQVIVLALLGGLLRIGLGLKCELEF